MRFEPLLPPAEQNQRKAHSLAASADPAEVGRRERRQHDSAQAAPIAKPQYIADALQRDRQGK